MSPQEEFDKAYITGSEICTTLGICRTSLLQARRSGRLPGAIEVADGQMYVWDRVTVTPYLNAWKVILDVRRGVAQ